MTDKEMKIAVNAYLETLLWSETLSVCDEEGEPGVLTYQGTDYEDGCPLSDIIDSSDIETLNPKIIEEVEADLKEFAAYCVQEIGMDPFMFFDPSEVAHNFCLSRNRHGAGFFDSTWQIETKQAGVMFDSRGLANDLLSCANAMGTHGLTVWVKTVDCEEVLRVVSHS